MNKKTWIVSLSAVCLTLVGMLTLVGSYEANPGDKRNLTNYSSKSSESKLDTGPRAYGSELNGLLAHRNTRLAYSQRLSDAVSDIPGVAQGFVMLTESNAYAAVLLDHTGTGMLGGNASKYELDNTGTQEGSLDGVTGRDTENPDRIASGKNSWMTTENHENLSHPFKQTIALKIRELQPDVKDVFISANRDFVNQMNVYAQENWMGRPLDGYVQQFNAICDQVFAYPNVDRHAID
jgi:hypothetical protein